MFDENWKRENNNDLPNGCQNGKQVLEEYLTKFGFWSLEHYDAYKKQEYSAHFNYIKGRQVEVLMVAKKVAMVHELAKTLSDNNYKSMRYYKDGSLRPANDYENNDDRSSFLPVFEFTIRFFGADAHVWLVATMGHLYTKDFENQIKEPLQAFNSKIVEKFESNHDFKRDLPLLLEDVAKGSDALVLLFDNDLDGESISFEVIDTVRHVMKKPPCGNIMDVIYRARFFSVPEIKVAMQRLEKPDFYKFLAIDAQQKLELIMGKSFAGQQKRVLRWRFPNHHVKDMLFLLGPNIALAKIVEQYKVKENAAPKYTLELTMDINGHNIAATLESKVFNDRQSAAEVCQRLKEAKYCEVIADPVSVSESIAKIVEQYKVKENAAPKYTLELTMDINGHNITATLESKVYNDRQSAAEVCQRLKEAKYCEVIADPVSVSESIGILPGLNTSELFQFMSKHFGLSLLEIDQICQKLYAKAFITNPRTKSTKYPANIGDCVNYILRTFSRRVSPNYGTPDVSVDMSLNVEAALKLAALKLGVAGGNFPPIIPTEKFPSNMLMAPNESLVYSYICCRFLASFMPEYTYFKETTVFEIEDCKFEYSCFKSGEAGFTKALPKLKVETMEEDLSPNFILGNKFSCDVKVKEFPPPKLLSENELVERMESHDSIPKYLLILQKSGFININEDTREIRPTLLGINIVESYESAIPDIIEHEFRENLVQEFNDVATCYKDFVVVYDKYLKEIWTNFKKFVTNFDPSQINLDKFEPCFEKQNLGFYAN
uniref:DNA topoisomerase n=1 Tax=Panagrolaimus sp. ES5 TaxID=591445 RepID=A0AC34FIF6_9BILA